MKTLLILISVILINWCGRSLDSPSANPKGAALMIGLERVDDDGYWKKYKKHYDAAATAGVPDDVKSITAMIKSEKYSITNLLNEEATNARIFKEMRRIGKGLNKNDVFLLYFSGHGDEVPDASGDEKSKKDQVFVAYNDYALDDSIHVILSTYFKTTRNIMIVDACHSSSMNKIFTDFPVPFQKIGNKRVKDFSQENKLIKQVESLSACSYDQTEDIDEPYQLIYFGAAADSSLSSGFSKGGELTIKMKKVFDEATEDGDWESYDYEKYACKVSKKIITTQRLQFHEIGPPDPEFTNNQPFKIKL